MTAPLHPRRSGELGGALSTLGAYVLWGFLPLYFLLLAPTGPWEIVAWRILLALVFCAILLTLTRGWRRLGAILRRRDLLLWTAVAGALIYVNWQVYLIGTLTGHVIETSLGYFINPIVTVLLGVLVLRERLRPTQWAAIALAAVAVAVIVVGYGAFPWIALRWLLVRLLRAREEAHRSRGRRHLRADARVGMAHSRRDRPARGRGPHDGHRFSARPGPGTPSCCPRRGS